MDFRLFLDETRHMRLTFNRDPRDRIKILHKCFSYKRKGAQHLLDRLPDTTAVLDSIANGVSDDA